MHTAVVIADGQIHQKRIVMEKYGAQGTMHTIIRMERIIHFHFTVVHLEDFLILQSLLMSNCTWATMKKIYRKI